MRRIIVKRDDLRAYLQPVDLRSRECAEYYLDTFVSRITMDMLLIRVRKQAVVLRAGPDMVFANIDAPSKTLRVDFHAMQAANRFVEDRIYRDRFYQISLIRLFISGLQGVVKACESFERSLAERAVTSDLLLSYIDRLSSYHAMGSVKFCITYAGIKQELRALCGDDDIAESVLSPGNASLFNRVYAEQLRLAYTRLAAPHDYPQAVSEYRTQYGFIEGEDMDYESRDTEAFV
jgi:hypothetical protein